MSDTRTLVTGEKGIDSRDVGERLAEGFTWTSERVAMAERMIAAGLGRVMARGGAEDPYVAGELVAEAVSQVWLHVPSDWRERVAGEDCRGDSDGDGRGDDDIGAGTCRGIVALASWRSLRAVLSGHWLAGRVVDGKGLRRAVGARVDAEELGRVAAWVSVSPERFDALWSDLWASLRGELSGRAVALAGILVEGATIADAARRLGIHEQSAKRDAVKVRAIAHGLAKSRGAWVF